MSSTPIIYSWDDPGGPGRNLTGNLQDCLKQILLPCLVTGYQGKPAAGWALSFEEENGFAISSAEGSVGFTSGLNNMSPNALHIYIGDEMSGMLNDGIAGVGVRSGGYFSGSAGGNTGRQGLNLRDLLVTWPSYLKWVVIANNKTVHVNLFLTDSGLSVGSYYQSFSFGKYINLISSDFNSFMFHGGSYVPYGSTPGVGYAFMALRNPITNLSISNYSSNDGFYILQANYPTVEFFAYEAKNFTHLRNIVKYDGVEVGYVPGVFSFLECMASVDSLFNALGIQAVRPESDNIIDINSSLGFKVSYLFNGSAMRGGFLITDEKWAW